MYAANVGHISKFIHTCDTCLKGNKQDKNFIQKDCTRDKCVNQNLTSGSALNDIDPLKSYPRDMCVRKKINHVKLTSKYFKCVVNTTSKGYLRSKWSKNM